MRIHSLFISPENKTYAIFWARRSLFSKKSQHWRGRSHVEDVPTIYILMHSRFISFESKTYAIFFNFQVKCSSQNPWLWSGCSTLFTFQTIYIRIHSLFISPENEMYSIFLNFRARCSFLSKKKTKKCQHWRGWSHLEKVPDNIYSNTFALHFLWERNVLNLLQFPSEVFLSRPVTLKGLIATLTFCTINANTFALHSPENKTYAIFRARRSLLSKKSQHWRGLSHIDDLPDNIYSNTFALHYLWERNILNLLQFPSEVFLSKPATLKGLIATLTFQIINANTFALHFPWEQNVRNLSS